MSVYAAFVKGAGPAAVSPLGSTLTSAGIITMAKQAEADGVWADVFDYTQYQRLLQSLQRQRNFGRKTAVIAYSAGVGTGTLVTYYTKLDLIAAIDPSTDCVNYRIHAQNVLKSVLWHNNDLLSKITGIGGAGENPSLGFQEIIEITVNHLVADLLASIQKRVRTELLFLQGSSLA